MSDLDIFNRILDDSDVEDAVVATLQKWIDTYLTEVEDQHGETVGKYARPRSWVLASEFEKMPEDALPAIVVVSAGLDERPSKEGRRAYRAPWLIGVAAVVSSKDHVSTRRMAYRYAAAIRATLLQKQSLDHALDDTVRGVTWVDGRSNELPSDATRTVFTARQVFSIEVSDVVTAGGGPKLPDGHPYDAAPVVPDLAHVQITETKEPIQ